MPETRESIRRREQLQESFHPHDPFGGIMVLKD